ncbi:MAG: DUF3488 and transglutaminase-like domain-containing protein [Colwellia sp.]|nr:DUF3488 and transglutaminase-like domain-containing protein [Colwellia sp.]MCW8866581.1 DUF3488 and transglutaminase-like domain-containing protein [Colwellia sp.]MCW9080218.1 DUF3488 and transglutaminase-like domain-containing protein [Colwellia sp.]
MSIKHSKASAFTMSKNCAWLFWVCQLLNISSLSIELSAWMLGILALCLCWQALILSREKRLTAKASTAKPLQKINLSFVPSLFLKLLAISGCIAIAISAKQFGVLISMVHLLAFAYALKAFEITQRKDFYQHILLGLFLLASALIFRQDLVFSLWILFLVIINLAILHQVFAKADSVAKSSKTVAIMLLQSSLLAVVLFVIFPRLAPFWQVPLAKSAKTGLSDEVAPGDIANLALSSELAFRVNFNDEKVPLYSQLYWRAMTLENYDGRKWTRAKQDKRAQQISRQKFSPITSGPAISYQVFAEPNYQPWLFALSVATTTNSKLVLNRDYTVQSTTVVNQPISYQIKSYPEAPLALSISQESRQKNLSISKGSNPRLEQLASMLKAKYPDHLTLAKVVENTFRNQNFYYTLQAPQLINNSLDQFYFDTKAGFCVHYASSFTYLMRAAGIPARIVTGYLGGEYNNISRQNNSNQTGHLSIYQYDAHAWSEIWIEGIGWYRVDPTAAVDPERVSSGWSTALLEQQSELNGDYMSLYRLKQLAWLNTLRLQLDAIDYQWTRWVLGYSSKQQYDLLKRLLGKEVPWKAAALIAVALVLFMGLFTLFNKISFIKNTLNKKPPEQVLFNKCIAALNKKGIDKAPYQTIQQLCFIVSNELPQSSSDFTNLTTTFQLLRYQQYNKLERQALLTQLKTEVNCFLKGVNQDNTKLNQKTSPL